ncbi:MAG TPA: cytosine permease, partial [Gemmataceae bacterium]|nr:cytosine permease [Gemmataceae bacterium]
LVACGWFGIQTWIGGEAIYKILQKSFPAWKKLPLLSGLEIDLEKFTALPQTLTLIPHLGINLPQLACFLFFWGINMFVIYRGIDSIRFLLNIKAPLLILLGLALLGWAYHSAGGFGNMLAQPSLFEAGGSRQGQFWLFFFPALTANVGFWATLALNIPDFTRFSRSQRDQIAGQALGLPATMGLYSFIGVAVTSGASVIYPGEEQGKLWDPTYLLTLFENRVILVVALVSLSVATLATNIAANVVSPANDFAHVWPRMISFRTGGFLTGVIGILIMPWKLLENPAVYINKWLIGYSSLLGAVGGVLIADYFLIRRTRLDLPGLYRQQGPYWYSGGFNARALIALVAGIAPSIPGFVYQVTTPPDQDLVVNFWTQLYSYAWFVSFGCSFAIYGVLMNLPVPSRPGSNS